MTKKIQEQLKKYRGMDIPSLARLALGKEKEIGELKRQLLFGKITNHEDLRKAKKELTRILTIISEKAEAEIKASQIKATGEKDEGKVR